MSILQNVDSVIDRHLQIQHIGTTAPHYAHKQSALHLTKGRPAGFDPKALAQEAYQQVLENLASSPRFASKGPSVENWRFEKQLGHRTGSPETALERAIAALGDNWANQVPTASGLWDHKADKRRAVDLVERRRDGAYDLIELKVATATPLLAAMEIFVYGLLYVLARERYPTSQLQRQEVLSATQIRLCVLAPSTFYDGYSLSWLENDLTEAIRTVSTDRIGAPVASAFSFEAFPPEFSWPAQQPDLSRAVRLRRPVWPFRADLPTSSIAAQGPGTPFADSLKAHMIQWAATSGLTDLVENRRPWVLKPSHREQNLFRGVWWSHIAGHEHQWARALNSSQCFAVNLFAPLVEAPSAIEFVRHMSPDFGVAETDRLQVSFEQSPQGVAERVGERGQPTQIDAFFEIFREEKRLGVIGVEVKLSEREFGGCRGFSGRDNSGSPINRDPSRCLDGRQVFAAPEHQCFMREIEGRLYWDLIKLPESSFDLGSLAALDRCPFRHGLYQLMRNRVALDVLKSMATAEWCEFLACVHPSNQRARQLPEPVAGHSDAVEAFRRITGSRGIHEWDPTRVVKVIEAIDAAPDGWGDWMRSKYLLGSEYLR